MISRVLVVEDDEDIVDSVRTLLESEGYRVDAALNGRIALELLSRVDPLPCVVLLDLMMPIMNGFEFRRAQLANPRIATVPVVLMTAAGDLAAKTAELSAAGAVAKPFEIDDILRLVRRFAG